MPEDTRFHVGDDIGGGTIVRAVRTGGMGEVYLCEWGEYQFALKTLRKRSLNHSQGIPDALAHEVRSWMAIGRNPYVVYCMGLWPMREDIPFICMEWVRNSKHPELTLKEWIKDSPYLTLQLSLVFAVHICRGLILANRNMPGIVHQDLKPSNVLVSEGEIAKITDFGISRTFRNLSEDPNSRIGRIEGTPQYMAPEQWLGAGIDHRTDIYALGCMLYEMITRNPVYFAENYEKLKHYHVYGKIPQLLPRFQGYQPINRVLQYCLAKDKKDRYPHFWSLYTELKAIYKSLFGFEPQNYEVETSNATDERLHSITYLRLGDLSDSLEHIDKAIDLDPNLSNGHLYKSLILKKNQSYEQAIESADNFLKLESDNWEALIFRGTLHNQIKRFDRAKRDFLAALKLNPSAAEAYSGLAVVSLANNEVENAKLLLSQALSFDNSNLRALLMKALVHLKQGEFGAALEIYDSMSEEVRKRFDFQRGQCFWGLHDYPNAMKCFNHACEQEPDNAEIILQRGQLLYEMGKEEAGVQDLIRVTSLSPDKAMAYKLLGDFYQQRNDFPASIVNYSTSLKLGYQTVDIFIARGYSYEMTNDNTLALSDYHHAVELDPSDQTAIHYLAGIHYKIGNLEKAVECYQEALRISPEAEILYELGLCFYAQQKLQEAHDILMRCIETFPDFAPAYVDLSIILHAWAKQDQAFNYVNKAIQLEPDLGYAYLNLGRYYYDRGDYEQAKVQLRKGIELGDMRGQGLLQRLENSPNP